MTFGLPSHRYPCDGSEGLAGTLSQVGDSTSDVVTQRRPAGDEREDNGQARDEHGCGGGRQCRSRGGAWGAGEGWGGGEGEVGADGIEQPPDDGLDEDGPGEHADYRAQLGSHEGAERNADRSEQGSAED